jgi:hypothetical protein
MPESIPWDMQLETSIEGLILTKTRDRIEELNLEAIPGERVVSRKLPWIQDDDQLPTPCVIISPAPETTNWRDGTNERDQTIFAFLITAVLANGLDVTTKGLALQLHWRQQIRRNFTNLSQLLWADLRDAFNNLDDGSSFIHAQIESGDKFIEAAKREQRDASYYLLRVMVREPREGT